PHFFAFRHFLEILQSSEITRVPDHTPAEYLFASDEKGLARSRVASCEGAITGCSNNPLSWYDGFTSPGLLGRRDDPCNCAVLRRQRIKINPAPPGTDVLMF